MKKRCENKNSSNYNLYGGRGISVCDEWKTFEPFEMWANNNGYGNDLSIDRIDVNGDYEPSNCRWATKKEQANNRRSTIHFKCCGKIHTLSEWALILDIDYKLVNKYYHKNKLEEKIKNYYS